MHLFTLSTILSYTDLTYTWKVYHLILRDIGFSESHFSKEKQKAFSNKQRFLHNATTFVSDFNVFVEISLGVGALTHLT